MGHIRPTIDKNYVSDSQHQRHSMLALRSKSSELFSMAGINALRTVF